MTCVVAEVVSVLKLDGAFIALDNLENLEDEQLADLLIAFRDTLFSIPCIWWVLIGQSGLGSLIQALDPRVAERISGRGLELGPINLGELELALQRRVSRFHSDGAGKAPLTSQIHSRLFKASHGELRFVLKYSNSICVQFVKDMRQSILEEERKKNPSIEMHSIAAVWDQAMGKVMIMDQIPQLLAEDALKKIVKAELTGLYLKQKELDVLLQIGKNNGTRAKDYASFGVTSMQAFSSNFLSKLHAQHLLARQQEGRAVVYRLRGVALMAAECDLLRTEASAHALPEVSLGKH